MTDPSSQNGRHTAENLSYPTQFFPKYDLRNTRDMRYSSDMPDCNIRNIDASLLRALKVEAARQGVTLRDYVLGVLAKAVGWQGGETKVEVGGSEVRPEPAHVHHVCAGCGWEMEDLGYCPNCRRFNGEEKPKGKRKMTAEQFMELSPSDQMRAKREGKF